MIRQIQLVLSPYDAASDHVIRGMLAEELEVSPDNISGFKIKKKSVDARSRRIKVNLSLEVFIDEPVSETKLAWNPQDVSKKDSVIVIGAGPAGMFAAMRLIDLGKKPIIIERGKDVRTRRRDLAALNKLHLVNPDSNYCFGEGGAGTYSDGKLYTRSNKRGNVQEILELFVAHGADENILSEAHPHIGTNKLPQIIEAMRENILKAGGEIHFETRVVDFTVKENKITSVVAQKNNTAVEFPSNHIILATGHSARDIFELLHSKKIAIEAKPFAMGVRAEHPQSLIDSLQYHCPVNEVESMRDYLPAASYSMVHQTDGKGVYSFCMCPGGIIAPCATAQEEVVTNGWSPSKRNNPFANSGIVVAVDPAELKEYAHHGPFAGLRYQQDLEKMAWIAGGKTQRAPAQGIEDFVKGKLSSKLPDCSYQPGTTSAPLHELLPAAIGKRLQEGFKAFGQKMKGYVSNDALILGVESRTSSPVRIPRDHEKLHHPQIVNLFPCGEGAGYAGGIVSAAIDGRKCAEAICVSG
ncbi:MAG TPA: FAD-binding protein [Bacteroidia bacterium]|nr:FAD-binding protein [Bacteroidia bacterium]